MSQPYFGSAPLKGVEQVLGRLGYSPVRQTGSHRFYEKDGLRLPPLPIHKGVDVSDDTLRNLARVLGVSKHDLEAWAKKPQGLKRAKKSGQLDHLA